MSSRSTHLLLPDQPGIDDALLEHFQVLGVRSIAAYRLWCYRHGLDTGLDKTPEQRQSERALLEKERPRPGLPVGKDHRPDRAARIERIFRGELRDEGLTDVLSRIRRLYNNLEGDENSRAALRRLVLHMEKHTSFLRPAPVFKRFGHTVSNTYIAALEQLARHHKDWLRPPETWRPPEARAANTFHSLACHLLARYPLPECLDAAFFQGNTPEARQQQAWFKHVAAGNNLRTAGVPMRVTKRMAHIFMQQNRRCTIIHALRTA